MKKNLLKLTGGLFVVVATVAVTVSQPKAQNHDLVLQNVEALTHSELPPKINCNIEKNSTCRDKVRDVTGTVYDVEYADKIRA